jgi:hypothetical protein
MRKVLLPAILGAWALNRLRLIMLGALITMDAVPTPEVSMSMLFGDKGTTSLTRLREGVVSVLGIVNRESATSDEHHNRRTDDAAMSTLMRTLRNLRRVGLKVSTPNNIY